MIFLQKVILYTPVTDMYAFTLSCLLERTDCFKQISKWYLLSRYESFCEKNEVLEVIYQYVRILLRRSFFLVNDFSLSHCTEVYEELLRQLNWEPASNRVHPVEDSSKGCLGLLPVDLLVCCISSCHSSPVLIFFVCFIWRIYLITILHVLCTLHALESIMFLFNIFA